MKWVVLLLGAVILVLGVLLPEVQMRHWSAAWSTLAPNLFAELLGLLIAIAIAEVWIKSYRARRGVARLAPPLVKTLAPAIEADATLVKALDYTPREFKTQYKEYLDGGMSPTHITAVFKDKVEKACNSIDGTTLQRAIEAIAEADQFVTKFAGLLEPTHVVLLTRANTNWRKFKQEFDRKPRDRTDLAEAFLDAHDTINDIAVLFSFKEVFRKIVSRAAA